MKPLFNGRVANLFMVMLFVAIGASSTIAGVKDCDDPKWADHPLCTDPDPLDGPIQLGSGDDEWPAETGDDNTGDDIVFGGDGNDIIYGGEGSDELAGEAGDDLLEGQDGDDRLNGGDGSDTLMGGNGNDHLYVEGTENGDYSDGGDGYDYLHLSFLDNVYVEFEDPDVSGSLGFYSGSLYVKKVGTVTVHGEFKNIEFIYGSSLGGVYHGNDLANTIWGHEGDDFMYGHGGDDYLRGGGITLSHTDHIGDYLDGGEGNDKINGLLGNDYIIGGPGQDEIWINDNGNHDTVEDFEIGDDKIIIYNSNICWPDLTVTAVDSDGDGFENDTLVAWKVKNSSTSITLMDLEAARLSADDFIFEVEGEIPTYSGCP